MKNDDFIIVEDLPDVDTNCNGKKGSSQALRPDKITHLAGHHPDDEMLPWQIKHQLRRTSRAQSAKMVAVHRQAQLDAYRGQKAVELGLEVFKVAAANVEEIHMTAESYSNCTPEVAEMIQLAAGNMSDMMLQIPMAAVALNLRRSNLGGG